MLLKAMARIRAIFQGKIMVHIDKWKPVFFWKVKQTHNTIYHGMIT